MNPVEEKELRDPASEAERHFAAGCVPACAPKAWWIASRRNCARLRAATFSSGPRP